MYRAQDLWDEAYRVSTESVVHRDWIGSSGERAVGRGREREWHGNGEDWKRVMEIE